MKLKDKEIKLGYTLISDDEMAFSTEEMKEIERLFPEKLKTRKMATQQDVDG